MRIRFAPRLVPTVAAIAMIALTGWLGRWQAGRADEKAALMAMYESRSREAPVMLGGASGPAEALLYRHVRVAGTFEREKQIYVDNRIHAGRAGFEVVTPLLVEGSDRLALVNRGWVARDAGYPKPPTVAPAPAGRVEVSGIAALPPRRYLELSSQTVSSNVWQNLSLERYAEACGVKVLPVLILSDPPGAGLARVDEKLDLGIEKHLEYMLTWYALAATTFALWLFYGFRRRAD